MMKRLILVFSMLVITMHIVAQVPTALWGKAVQGTLGSMVTSQGADIQMAPDGGVYISGGAGTKTLEDIIRFGNDQIAAPATEYKGNGNTGTQNLFVAKVAADGTPQWTVYSKNGHVMSGSAYIQPVTDGLMVVFGIQHPTKLLTNTVSIVDALNQVTDLQWTLAEDDKNYYRLVVMKLNQNGALQWVRQVEADHTAKTDGFSLNAVQVDEAGNVLIGGQQKATLYWPKADGTTATLEVSANGADFLLVKIDQDGFYQDRFQLSGSLLSANVRDIKYFKDRFYLTGIVKGAASTEFSVGTQKLMLANGFESLLMVSLNSDLTVNWAKVYDSKKNFNMQQTTLYANPRELWLAGMADISLTTKAGKDLTIGENMNRVGTVLKFDITNGDMLDGYLKPLFQSGYFALFEDSEGMLYAAGYPGVFSGSSNPNKREIAGGLFIDKFSPDNLSAPISSWEDVIKNVGSPQGIAYTADGHLYTLTRSTSTANYIGSSSMIIQDVAAFCCNVCLFRLPVSLVTVIREIKGNSQPVIDGYWYNLNGQRVELPKKGIYIQNGKKVVVD